MRIGELSDRTGVPVPTIKYYVREGLLPGGERTSRTQVSYGEEHVRRLRLVRALVEVGGLPIAKVGEVLTEAEDPRRDLDGSLGVVSYAMSHTRESSGEADEADLREAAAIAADAGWRMKETRYHIKNLAEVLRTLRLLGLEDMIERVDAYVKAARLVARSDIELLTTRSDRDEVLETMILGTVMGDALFAALRRIAHVEYSGQRFSAPGRERHRDDCEPDSEESSLKEQAQKRAAEVDGPGHARMAMSARVGFLTSQVDCLVLCCLHALK